MPVLPKNLVIFFPSKNFGITKNLVSSKKITKFLVIPKNFDGKKITNFLVIPAQLTKNLVSLPILPKLTSFFGHYVKSAKNLVIFFRYCQKFGNTEKNCLRQFFLGITKFSAIPKKITKFLALFLHTWQILKNKLHICQFGKTSRQY